MDGASHSVTIEQRRKISATAIEAVEGFSDRQIILCFSEGKIIIGGSGLKITAFSSSSGNFCAVGEISSLKYVKKGLSLAKKLFR